MRFVERWKELQDLSKEMKVICKIFGHKWKVTQKTFFHESLERVCVRCNKVMGRLVKDGYLESEWLDGPCQCIITMPISERHHWK